MASVTGVVGAQFLLIIANPSSLLAWVSGAYTVIVGALIVVPRRRRQRDTAAMLIPFPTDVGGAPAPGVLAVGTTEVVTWRRLGLRSDYGAPAAAVPRDRIYDATFEDGHRLVGGGWIHLVGVDGKRAILMVRQRDVAAGRRVAYALSRQAVPAHG